MAGTTDADRTGSVRVGVIGGDATYVGATSLDPQEDALVAGRLPTEPGWGAVDESAWGTRGAGDDVEAVPTFAGDDGAFSRGVAQTVRTGAAPPVTIEDGIAVLEVLDAAQRSAAGHEVVHLDR